MSLQPEFGQSGIWVISENTTLPLGLSCLIIHPMQTAGSAVEWPLYCALGHSEQKSHEPDLLKLGSQQCRKEEDRNAESKVRDLPVTMKACSVECVG